jgi:hypothetical protein
VQVLYSFKGALDTNIREEGGEYEPDLQWQNGACSVRASAVGVLFKETGAMMGDDIAGQACCLLLALEAFCGRPVPVLVTDGCTMRFWVMEGRNVYELRPNKTEPYTLRQAAAVLDKLITDEIAAVRRQDEERRNAPPLAALVGLSDWEADQCSSGAVDSVEQEEGIAATDAPESSPGTNNR